MYSGLSAQVAKERLVKDGLNLIPEKKVSLLSKILKNLSSPISVMLFVAGILSFVVGKRFDGNFILFLLGINVAITLWQENKADNAIGELNKHLTQKVKTRRNNNWIYIESQDLVVGDIIQLASGEVVPADGKILEANRVEINESSISGESLPKEKKISDLVYSGSYLTSGVGVVEIVATGTRTSLGKTLFVVEKIHKKSLLEQDIIGISKFLTTLSLIGVAILATVLLIEKQPYLEILTLSLGLIIAGVPISLPTVMTLIIEFGVLNLAKKKAIVRRLSALEDLANVNLFLSDKTGTLTKNKIVIKKILSHGEFSQNDVITYASIVAELEGDNPIDQAVLEINEKRGLPSVKFEVDKFIPFDSTRKRNTVWGKEGISNLIISVGAPQVIEKLCKFGLSDKVKYEHDVMVLANEGYRTLAVAIGRNKEEKNLKLVGILGLSDELRSDAESVVEFLEKNGIDLVMVTGDNQAIAEQITSQLSIGSKRIVSKEELDKMKLKEIDREFFLSIAGVAEILPEDKLKLVNQAKKFFVVASNGDGVNDLPAVKSANVGIAVANAVSVLKSSADIVLMTDGIKVIKDAIIESRKIFERIYIYSLYRISESFRLIVTTTILGIIYRFYPLTPLQIILIALLNDVPIISLAFDRVKVKRRPAKINVRSRFIMSTLFGLVGVVNSMLMFYLTKNVLELSWQTIQTMFFLKLTVSGHLLIFVAHTKERWYKFLPSKEVIWATVGTQLIATVIALGGFLMPTKLKLWEVIVVWVWAFFWMQVGEGLKLARGRYGKE